MKTPEQIRERIETYRARGERCAEVARSRSNEKQANIWYSHAVTELQIAGALEWVLEGGEDTQELERQTQCLEDKIDRVADLHQPKPWKYDDEWTVEWCYSCMAPWPCETFGVIDQDS